MKFHKDPFALKSLFLTRTDTKVTSLNSLICGLHLATHNKSRTGGAVFLNAWRAVMDSSYTCLIIRTAPGSRCHWDGTALLSWFVKPEIEKLAHLPLHPREGLKWDWGWLSQGKSPDGCADCGPLDSRCTENNDL